MGDGKLGRWYEGISPGRRREEMMRDDDNIGMMTLFLVILNCGKCGSIKLNDATPQYLIWKKIKYQQNNYMSLII